MRVNLGGWFLTDAYLHHNYTKEGKSVHSMCIQGLFPVWILWCWLTLDLQLKDFLHSLHMSSPVSKETLVLSKRFPTFTAFKRPCYGMHCSVSNEMGSVAKGFSSFTAFIRLFSSVNPLVLNEDRFLTKGFPTSTALIRLFSSVNSLVLNKERFLTKIFHIHKV